VKCSRQQWFFSSSFSVCLAAFYFKTSTCKKTFWFSSSKFWICMDLASCILKNHISFYIVVSGMALCCFGKSELTIYTDHLIHICVDIFTLFLGSPPAIERLSSGLFQEVIITNTIPVAEKNHFPQLTVLSVASLLGETIWRVHDDCSVSSIFQ